MVEKKPVTYEDLLARCLELGEENDKLKHQLAGFKAVRTKRNMSRTKEVIDAEIQHLLAEFDAARDDFHHGRTLKQLSEFQVRTNAINRRIAKLEDERAQVVADG